jgi:hypothetical protein
MNAVAQAVLAGVLLASAVLPAAGQAAGSAPDVSNGTQAAVSFQFDHNGLPVPHFVLRLREDGTGSYQAEQAARHPTDTNMRGEAEQHIDRELMLSPMMAAKIFKAARSLDHFNVACASKAKNIADTGTKTLTYKGADGAGSCVYNYSENKTVAMLTDAFIGIAYTMDEGRKLEFLHRYDRLGLDAEMNTFTAEVDSGRALELGTIAPTLAAIADDNAVIQRVRLRAEKMLEQSKESH